MLTALLILVTYFLLVVLIGKSVETLDDDEGYDVTAADVDAAIAEEQREAQRRVELGRRAELALYSQSRARVLRPGFNTRHDDGVSAYENGRQR